ncbi:MAG: RDD family protein [Cytophagales bacterium]|nr:RDD family protein [Cytophagales bacterium]
MKKRQFNLDHHKIHEALQGAHLASFGSRGLSFVLDFGIVYLINMYVNVFFWIVVLLLLLNRKYRHMFSWKRRRAWVNGKVHKVEQRADRLDMHERNQVRLRKFLRLYSHVLVHAGFVLVLLFLASSLWVSFSLATDNDQIWGLSVLDSGFIGTFNEGIGVFFNTFLGLVYFIFFTWYFQGQTPAKRLLKIRVMKLNGKRLSIWNSLERVTGYVSSASLLGLGFLQVFWDKNHQTTHDKICETVVVRDSETLRNVVAKTKDSPVMPAEV